MATRLLFLQRIQHKVKQREPAWCIHKAPAHWLLLIQSNCIMVGTGTCSRRCIWKSQALRLCWVQHKRKNWLFNQTPRGADASAILYSLVQTAIANNLEPFEYLQYLFAELPKLGRHNEAEALDQFLPWNSTEKIKALYKAVWFV